MSLYTNAAAFLLSLLAIALTASLIISFFTPAIPPATNAPASLQPQPPLPKPESQAPQNPQPASPAAKPPPPANQQNKSATSENYTIWYFAYGSNLNQPALRARIGGWGASLPATLPGFRREFVSHTGSGYGVANIVEDKNSSVSGALYLINASGAAALDRYEGVPTSYVRISVSALANDTQISAYAYQFAKQGFPARPSSSYLKLISDGLASFGYGNEIISSVEKEAGRQAQ